MYYVMTDDKHELALFNADTLKECDEWLRKNIRKYTRTLKTVYIPQ